MNLPTRYRAREQKPLLRVLFSCPFNELMRDYLSELVRGIAPNCSGVATVIPPGVEEEALLETAAKQRFNVAVVVLNNVSYPPHDPAERLATLASDGVALVRKMRCLFRIPIIALYGWPTNDGHAAILIRAGATFALRLPFEHAEMKQALRWSLLGSKT
jgi:hypothetical protein